MSVAVTVAAGLLRWALDPLLGETQPFPTFYVAVVVATLWLGWGPAITVAILGYVTEDWFFLAPRGALGVTSPGALAHTLLYFAVSATLIYAIARSRRATGKLQAANESLLQAEQEWERTFENVPDPIALIDPEHRIKRVNRAMAERLGLTREQCIGLACYECVHGLAQPLAGCPHALSMADGRVHTCELHEERLRGDFLVTTTPLRDEQGRITGSVHVARDITQEKQAERALREQAQLAHLRADAMQALQQPAAMQLLLQQVAALLVERLDAAFARVWTLDASGQILELRASAGLYTHLDGAHSRVPVGQLKIGRIAQERQPLVTNQVIGDPHIPGQDWARREGLVAFAGFPLLLEGRLLGVVALFARHTLSPAAVETFSAVAGLLAQALGRVEAQAALTREKDFSDTTINSLPGIFYLVDAQNHLRRWNQNLEAVTGHSAEEIRRLTALDFLAEEDQPRAAEAIARVLARGEVATELQLLTKAKGKLPYVFTGRRLDFEGQTGFLGVGLDISERKRAEARVADLNQRLAAELADMNRLHQVSTQFVRQADLQTLLKAILEAAIAITGATKGHLQLVDEASGELGITVHRGYDDAFVEFFSHIRTGEVACGTAMESRQCVVVEDLALSPLFLAEPRALQFMLAANVRAVICTPLLAGTGRVVGVLSAHFAAPHRPLEREMRLLELLATQAAEFVERTKAEAALRSAREELARANAELDLKVQRRTARLQEALADLEHMSYSMVHDMRAPLRAMQTFATLAEEECSSCVRTQGRDYFRRIREASSRLDRLVTDALAYNKVIRQEPIAQPVELGKLLRGMIETYPNLQPAVADIHMDFEALLVIGNESLLTQSFGNLLDNAVKFVPPGVRPRIRLWAEEVRSSEEVQSPRSKAQGQDAAATNQAPAAPEHKDGGSCATTHPESAPSARGLQPSSQLVRVWVEDNGIGIPREAHERIFLMFQRMHSEKEYPGTGIGLTIVKKAIERMGGRIGLESEPSRGSRFWVELATSGPEAHMAATLQDAA